MEFIEPILSLASDIYKLVENVKANKKRCRRVADRVKGLENLVKSIKERENPGTPNVEKALEDLTYTLQSAKELINTYASANWLERILKSSSYEEGFGFLNDRLSDAYQVLSGSLQVEQGNVLYKVFKLSGKEKEKDKREDEEELKKFIRDHGERLERLMQMLDKPSIPYEDIQLITPNDLKYEQPKRPFMTTSTSEVYKGEYRGFTVAIKRYTEPVNTSPGEVKFIFDKEVQTMKRFESPNILRMFGICLQDEHGPSPQFLIIMEYCEKGSLRQVLDSDCTLSWTTKAHMCLDAAQGLYRLHQTEEKSKVHGSINSSKFLVAEGYRVKLGGFELAKTETSLKKVSKSKESTSLCYSSPQILGNVNHVYSKECEMYSFGILMWEISTRKRPFQDYSREHIYQKVCEEKYQEPLPDDCPESLKQLIDDCRAFDSFHRPSARELVDKLRTVVAQLEQQ